MPESPSQHPSRSSERRLAAPYAGSGTALPANTVVAGKARFTVLGEGLIRIEWSEGAQFEDRPSFFAVQRDLPAQDFKQSEKNGVLNIRTAKLALSYTADGKPFHAGNLSIRVLDRIDWKAGQAQTGNLGGSLRTLDECDGPWPLGEGVLSRDGWYLRDDSKTVLYTDEANPWVAPRRPDGDLDWYFFGYGSDLQAGLRDFVKIGGAVPLPPRFTLGSWYSRYWPYTTNEYLEIADDYRAKGFPLDVMVLDMDWHKDGWTGYSWNRDLIPDPPALLGALRERGLRTTMNLHPHDGVAKHEDAYEAFAKAMGRDFIKGERVPFDVTDKSFVENYFKLLLHPLEKDGVDFWWMDWQQGTDTAIPGLDPLMWLNHLHFRDRQRQQEAGALRGLAFSRWAGWGDHRHPVHFSGDTHANWEVLDYLSTFTASAGNVGVGFWSHDLGGHFGSGGRIDPELYLRWIQFGALSPVMRVHSTRDPKNDRRPWLYSEEFTQAAREAYALRSELVPYLYTASREAFDKGLPLLRPMYLHYPEAEAAYQSPSQFMVGEDLLMAPAARPGSGAQKVAQVRVWFPEGLWYHYQTHERFEGPLETLVAVPLNGVALFVRGGAVLPLNHAGGPQACASDGALHLRIYPGPDTQRSLYEDDGETRGYQHGEFRRWPLDWKTGKLSIGAAQGEFSGAGAQRPAFVLDAPFWGAKASTDLSSAPSGESLDVAVEARYKDDVAPLAAALLGLQKRCELAARQLPEAAAEAKQLRELAAGIATYLEGPLAKDALAAVRKQAEDFQARAESSADALLKRAAETEAAWRVLLSLAFYAQILPGKGLGTFKAELELRRDAAAVKATVGKIECRWKIDGRPLGQHGGFDAGKTCVSVFEGELEFDRQQLANYSGNAEIELNLSGRKVVLHETLAWKGDAPKDWALLGPVGKDLELNPSSGEDACFSEEYAKVDGAKGGWVRENSDPSRVARGLRHFYAWGDKLKCPEAAVYGATVLEAEKAGPAKLLYHWDAGESEIRLNGKPLPRNEEGVYAVDLKAGANLVVIRVAGNPHSGKAFYLSVEPGEGAAELGLTHRAPELRAAAVSSNQP